MSIKTKVVYRLGEVAKWSVGAASGEHRYVDIETFINFEGSIASSSKETITLPTEQAQRLVRTMMGDSRFVIQMLQRTVDGLKSGDGRTHWTPEVALVPLVQAMRRLSHSCTAWLGTSNCKYMGLRIDLRGGAFVVLDGNGARAEVELIQMLTEENYEPSTKLD